MKMKQTFLIIIGVLLVIGIAAIVFFSVQREAPDNENNTNTNTAALGNVDRAPLPENRDITDQERVEYNIPAGIEGTIQYSHDEYGQVVSTLKITEDTRPTDSDFDGISDQEEKNIGTDPENQDSDYDGWLDGGEVEYGTNPLKPDTDGDTLSDYDELIIYKTDPLKIDSDDDGFDDNVEINSGHDPLN